MGITEQATNLLDAISVFPNPAHEQATVQLALPAYLTGKVLQLTLTAADGRVVERSTIHGAGTHTFELVPLSPGLYAVHVSDGNTWLTGAKLMVE